MGPYTFDPEKAVEALLYVTRRTAGDMYATLKLLYLADKLHLHRYGRFIFGDEHHALPYGPVPQGAYDLIKCARGEKDVFPYEPVTQAIRLEGNTIEALRPEDRSVFSDSDEECLDEAIATFGARPFNGLKEVTHDAAFNATARGHKISMSAIAALSENPAALVQHLSETAPDRE